MKAQLAAGDRAEAVRSYTELRDLPAETMGVSPAPEVEALYLTALG